MRAHIRQQNTLVLVLATHVIEVDIKLIVLQLLRVDFDSQRRIEEAEHIPGQILEAS